MYIYKNDGGHLISRLDKKSTVFLLTGDNPNEKTSWTTHMQKKPFTKDSFKFTTSTA